MILSILVCTTHSRVSTFLPKIITELCRQASEFKDVEVRYFGDNKTMSVGAKRNDMIWCARGSRIAFFDDDDIPATNYIHRLREETIAHLDADVITFDVMRHENGKPDRKALYSLRFQRDANLSSNYERLPNHLMCWKKSLAEQVAFKDVNFGEDELWAKEMKRIARTEFNIPEVLYTYDYHEKTTETNPEAMLRQ